MTARLLQVLLGAAVVIAVYYAGYVMRGSREWQDTAYREYILQSYR
jgi:hypothetical protein